MNRSLNGGCFAFGGLTSSRASVSNLEDTPTTIRWTHRFGQSNALSISCSTKYGSVRVLGIEWTTHPNGDLCGTLRQWVTGRITTRYGCV